MKPKLETCLDARLAEVIQQEGSSILKNNRTKLKGALVIKATKYDLLLEALFFSLNEEEYNSLIASVE